MARDDDLYTPLKVNREKKAAVKPARRKQSARVMSTFFIAITFFALTLGAAFLYLNSLVMAPGPLTAERMFVVERGARLTEIAASLEEQNIIINRYAFMARAAMENKQARLKAGEFRMRAGVSMRQVLDMLSKGAAVQYALTVPEGLTSRQIVARIMNNEYLTGNITHVPAEGALMPDTYKFTRGTKRSDLIRRMENAQGRLLASIWQQRAERLPLASAHEMLILASIVERETAKPEERARIAGVFLNRLRKGMRLQSDPTIIYGLVGGQGGLGRPIRKSEIDKPTPYNTYVINGLPPGPIGNPGRASLQATARPAITDDLYFVADGTGGHAFARTLREHQANVRKWRRIERKRRLEIRQLPRRRPKNATVSADTRRLETGANGQSIGSVIEPAASN